MTQDNAKRSPSGRSALGGAACGLTYDGVTQDAMAREDRLRRPLKLHRWHAFKDREHQENAQRRRLEQAVSTPHR